MLWYDVSDALDNNNPLYQGIVYLDQNIISYLRPGGAGNSELTEIMQSLYRNGLTTVISDVNRREIEQSGRQDEYLEALRMMGTLFLPTSSLDALKKDGQIQLERVSEHISSESDFSEFNEIERSMDDMLKLANLLRGKLGAVSADELKAEVLDSAVSAISGLSADLPPEWKPLLDQHLAVMIEELRSLIRGIPMDKYLSQAKVDLERWTKKIPDFAMIDAIPDSDVVEYLISLLEVKERMAVQKDFPKGFFRGGLNEFGSITGLSFMMFYLGLVRVKNAQKGSLEKRHKAFLGQFRDCQHIEHAGVCHAFLTADEGAARLAKAVFLMPEFRLRSFL